MSIEEENIAIVRRYLTEADKGNFSIIDELFSPNFSSRQPHIVPSNRAEWKRLSIDAEGASEYLSRSQYTFSANGSRVTVIDTSISRVTRDLADIRVAPENRRWLACTGRETWRVVDGKIVEYLGGEIIKQHFL